MMNSLDHFLSINFVYNLIQQTSNNLIVSSSEQTKLQPLASDQLIATIIEAIHDVKGKRITKIDLRNIDDASAAYFVICEGDSTTQVKGISDRIHTRVKEELGLKPDHIEGKDYARWVLLDYFDVVVHVFYPETRALYDLEDLWSDGIQTEYDSL